MADQDFEIDLVVENSIARIKLTGIALSTGSPKEAAVAEHSEVVEEQAAPDIPGIFHPRPSHSMRLRSQARESPIPSSSSSSLPLPPDEFNLSAIPVFDSAAVLWESDAIEERYMTVLRNGLSEHTTTGHRRSHASFMDLYELPDIPAARVWEGRRASNHSFTILRDFVDEEAEVEVAGVIDHFVPTVNDFDFEEDKENVYTTASDYESPPEPELPPTYIDQSIVEAMQQDAFGLPQDLSIFTPNAPFDHIHHPPSNGSTGAPRPIPGPVLVFVGLEHQHDPDFENVPVDQVSQLQDLNETYQRVHDSRRRNDRRFAMRQGETVQGPNNPFLDFRRATEFQRRQIRRRNSLSGDEE
ncbi:hypothetical protein NUU61_006797 [Penicillium alfredii]|uniref:Uncharacterized protein n=1 Tax=Penicillium alfredii TaxID=1506179 RepID=A0A9W9F1N9_9EURO|nr:uncharacterized protein NUU61_006797 [Penicillium alfredii]KAJ5091927.1 hypothetical protein NUU61_006797 [Penicillium alfredii]